MPEISAILDLRCGDLKRAEKAKIQDVDAWALRELPLQGYVALFRRQSASIDA